MLSKLLVAAVLVAATIVTHVIGSALSVRVLTPGRDGLTPRTWQSIWFLIRMAWLLILFHALEISIWAIFYLRRGCLPDAETAFYFSGITYTTVGFGDLLLPVEWRILAPIEALCGILMCGLSASIFFATVSRIYMLRYGTSEK